MSTTKEILEGNTSRFAFKVAFQLDPDEGAGATDEEVLSWGGFEIWVEGQNLCAHREDDTIVQAAHWYLLPLFEWLTSCWDYLLHEERLPLQVEGDDSWHSLQATFTPPPALDEQGEERWDREWQDWWQRHSLLACRQGALYPDVIFRRWRDRVEISWGQRRLAGQPDDFCYLFNEGFARLPVAEVAQPLFSVLRLSIDHLVRQAPDSERFATLKNNLDTLGNDNTSKRLALLAGLGTTLEGQEARWQEVSARLQTHPNAAAAALTVESTELFLAGSCQASLMFGSVAPTINADDVTALAGKLIDLYTPGHDESPELANLVREKTISAGGKRPWLQGYNLAQEILEDLSLPEAMNQFIDVQAIYKRLGIHVDSLPLNDLGIRAVSLAGPDHRPSTVINPNHVTNHGESGRRFTLAHELCHILFDRSYGARLAIASGPWAPRDLERRANAFAAMLLMPPELIRRILSDPSAPLASAPGVREMALTLRTGFKATLEHLKNLNFLSEEDYERIQFETD